MEKPPQSPSEYVAPSQSSGTKLPELSQIESQSDCTEKLGLFYLSNGQKCKEIRVYAVADMYSTGGVGVDVDVDTKFKPIQPNIQIYFNLEKAHRDTYCVVNSILYLFAGFEPIRCPPGTPRRCAAKCVLSLPKPKLEKICNMNHSKWWPEAIPTPDSKRILVFSAALLDKYAEFGFEIYDIDGDSWDTLPGLPIGDLPQGQFCHSAKSYSFIDKSHFLVETTEGTFTLNLQSKNWSRISNWEEVDDGSWCCDEFISLRGGQIAVTAAGVYEGVNHEILTSEVGIEGQMDDLPYGGYVRRSECRLSKFPPNDPPEWYGTLMYPSIVPLHMVEEDRVLKTCTLQAERDGAEGDESGVGYRVLIDVSRVDLNTLKTEVVNTIRAHIRSVNGSPILKLFPL